MMSNNDSWPFMRAKAHESSQLLDTSSVEAQSYDVCIRICAILYRTIRKVR